MQKEIRKLSLLVKKIVITNNSSKYIYQFKRNLIKSLIENNFEVTVIAPKDEYSKRFSEIGANYYPINMDTNGLNPIKDLILIRDLYRAYKDIGATSNLLFTIKPNIYGTIASHLRGLKTINNVTGLGSVFLRRGLVQLIVKILYRSALRFSTKVMFQNSEDRDLFINQKLVCPSKAILIPGSGVDVQRFRPRTNIEKEKIIFLMIGRILIDKGVLEYIEAARLSKSENVEFWLLGECDVNSRSSIKRKTISIWENEGIIKYIYTK